MAGFLGTLPLGLNKEGPVVGGEASALVSGSPEVCPHPRPCCSFQRARTFHDASLWQPAGGVLTQPLPWGLRGRGKLLGRGDRYTSVRSPLSALYTWFPLILIPPRNVGCLFLFTEVKVKAQRSKVTYTQSHSK